MVVENFDQAKENVPKELAGADIVFKDAVIHPAAAMVKNGKYDASKLNEGSERSTLVSEFRNRTEGYVGELFNTKDAKDGYKRNWLAARFFGTSADEFEGVLDQQKDQYHPEAYLEATKERREEAQKNYASSISGNL